MGNINWLLHYIYYTGDQTIEERTAKHGINTCIIFTTRLVVLELHLKYLGLIMLSRLTTPRQNWPRVGKSGI